MYRWSNCILYAFGRFWREGGYVVMLWSNHWIGPHVLWSADLKTFHEFVPARYAGRQPWWYVPVVFKGYVRVWSQQAYENARRMVE